MLDARGRPLRDLRISVTDQCNFRCSYCMPAGIFDEHYPFLQQDELLTIAELVRLTRIFTTFGVNKVRITGGEPLLRKDIDQYIQEIAQMNEVDDIALTTNGILLEHFAPTLKKAGLQRVNVSLDSLRDDTFGEINGRGISTKPVLVGMDAALRAGLDVKVNMVVKKGVNEEDIIPMATYFREKGITLRFIEYMDVGNTNGWKLDE